MLLNPRPLKEGLRPFITKWFGEQKATSKPASAQGRIATVMTKLKFEFVMPF